MYRTHISVGLLVLRKKVGLDRNDYKSKNCTKIATAAGCSGQCVTHRVGLPYVLFFNQKRFVLRRCQKMPKCSPFWYYEPQKHVKSFFYEKIWEVLVQTTVCGRDDLFLFGTHVILDEKLDICGRDDHFLVFT